MYRTIEFVTPYIIYLLIFLYITLKSERKCKRVVEKNFANYFVIIFIYSLFFFKRKTIFRLAQLIWTRTRQAHPGIRERDDFYRDNCLAFRSFNWFPPPPAAISDKTFRTPCGDTVVVMARVQKPLVRRPPPSPQYFMAVRSHSHSATRKRPIASRECGNCRCAQMCVSGCDGGGRGDWPLTLPIFNWARFSFVRFELSTVGHPCSYGQITRTNHTRNKLRTKSRKNALTNYRNQSSEEFHDRILKNNFVVEWLRESAEYLTKFEKKKKTWKFRFIDRCRVWIHNFKSYAHRLMWTALYAGRHCVNNSFTHFTPMFQLYLFNNYYNTNIG